MSLVGQASLLEASRQASRVWEFLDEPLWGSGWRSGTQFEAWKERGLSLGPGAPAVFLEALKIGAEEQQYAALYALRLYGYETLQEGRGARTVYRVRARNQAWQSIRPHTPPQEP